MCFFLETSDDMAAPLLTLRGAHLGIGSQTLFADLDVAIGRGDRICLVGRNGAGKSTLLKAIAGSIELDRGERFLQPRTRVAYLPQEPALRPGAWALEAVLDGHSTATDGGADHLAEAILARFDVAPDLRVDDASGGEARRISLARALIGEPEILLLDEPTNHLDIRAIERLENDLETFAGALVMISHDRRFLTALSRTTWWLDRGRVRTLDRGFEAFERWSEDLLAEEENELRRLSKAIESETEWLHFGVTARRKRNQGRLRRLQAMRQERAERLRPEGQARLETQTAGKSGRLVIEAKSIRKAFGERLILDDFSTRIMRGDRIGIIGPNGAGKTTLIRLLIGELAPDSGDVRQGTNLQIATIDQRRDSLDPSKSPWQTLCPDDGDQVEVQGSFRHVVGYLKDFLFRPEQLRTPIRALSGGERNRLLLARELARPANLLVMDEPTNDLDMDTLDLLQEMLTEFDGTLLLVSHDRDFLDRLVTGTIVLEGDGEAMEYAGGYNDYLSQRRRPAAAGSTKIAPGQARPAGARTDHREQGRRQRQAERDRARLEQRIERLETEKAALETALADPDFFVRDPDGFAARTKALAALQSELDQAEERWLELELEAETASP